MGSSYDPSAPQGTSQKHGESRGSTQNRCHCNVLLYIRRQSGVHAPPHNDPRHPPGGSSKSCPPSPWERLRCPSPTPLHPGLWSPQDTPRGCLWTAGDIPRFRGAMRCRPSLRKRTADGFLPTHARSPRCCGGFNYEGMDARSVPPPHHACGSAPGLQPGLQLPQGGWRERSPWPWWQRTQDPDRRIHHGTRPQRNQAR